MHIFLSSEERIHLLTQHRGERDKRIADRIKSLLLADEGMNYIDIAKVLFIDDQSVSRFVREYKEDQKLKPLNGGSKERLSEEQSKELSAHLEEKLYTKAKDIAAYVLSKYKVHYAVSGMTNWLKKHNFSFKKPKGIPAKADPIKQQEFIEYYSKLIQTTQEEEPILFLDAVHPTMETKLSCGWIRKGKDHEIPTTGNRTRLNILGALNLQLMITTTKNYDTINNASAQDFFSHLIYEAYKDAPKVHLILDNAGYFTSKEIKEFEEKNPRIKLHYLPPYSPNLNPIEPLWKIFHEYVSNNRYYSSAKEFKESVFEFFSETFPNISHTLIDRLTDNFRVLYTLSSA